MTTSFRYVMPQWMVRRPFKAGPLAGKWLHTHAVTQKKGWIVARYATDGQDEVEDAELAILLCEAKYNKELK